MTPARDDIELLVECHRAFDEILARLVQADPSFRPTRWAHWPTLERLTARIRGAERAAAAAVRPMPSDTTGNHGAALRAARKRAGLTQALLAERVGTTAQHIGQFELGKRELTISWIMRFASALGISPRSLLPNGGE